MMLAFALSAGTMAGCGDKAGKEPAAKTEASETKEDAEDYKAPEEEKKDSKENADYSSWTGKEWNAASDADKKEAGRYFLVETTKATAEAAGQEWTDQMESAAITDQAVEAEIAALDQLCVDNESMSISDLIRQTAEAAGAIIDQAAQQATE